MNSKPDNTSPEDVDTDIDWETLDSRVSTAVQEIEAALEEALAATRDLSQWVGRLHTLSAFMQQVESGLAEVKHQLKGPPQVRRPAPVAPEAPKVETAEMGEPWPIEPEEAEPEVVEESLLTALEQHEAESSAEPSEAVGAAEAESSAEPSEAVAVAEAESSAEPFEGVAVAEAEGPPRPVEEKPSEGAPGVAGATGSIRLQIESSEANIDLMVVERALRETPGVADVDLLDYAGRRARLQVTLSEGERPEEVADPERLAANVQERLAKLTWNGSISVSTTE